MIGTMVLGCGLTQALPALALFVLPGVAALHFVAFREMFLGDAHNAAEFAKAATSVAVTQSR